MTGYIVKLTRLIIFWGVFIFLKMDSKKETVANVGFLLNFAALELKSCSKATVLASIDFTTH